MLLKQLDVIGNTPIVRSYMWEEHRPKWQKYGRSGSYGSNKYELTSTLSALSFILNKCYSDAIHYNSLNVNLLLRIRRFLPHVSTAPF
jgi:hypothetical protein